MRDRLSIPLFYKRKMTKPNFQPAAGPAEKTPVSLAPVIPRSKTIKTECPRVGIITQKGAIMMDIDFDQLKIGLQLFKESIGLIKDVKDTLPESPQKEAASKSLIAAEVATQIAEANIAKAFGYLLFFEVCK